jgi:hypothetical protein
MVPHAGFRRIQTRRKALLEEVRSILPDERVYVCCDFGVDLF